MKKIRFLTILLSMIFVINGAIYANVQCPIKPSPKCKCNQAGTTTGGAATMPDRSQMMLQQLGPAD